MQEKKIYLTKKEKSELKEIEKILGKSQNEIFREAIDQYIERCKSQKWKNKITIGRGLWKDRDDIPDVETLRKENDDRLL